MTFISKKQLKQELANADTFIALEVERRQVAEDQLKSLRQHLDEDTARHNATHKDAHEKIQRIYKGAINLLQRLDIGYEPNNFGVAKFLDDLDTLQKLEEENREQRLRSLRLDAVKSRLGLTDRP